MFGVKVTGVNTAEPAGQAQAYPVRLGQAAGHQAGHRDPRRGRPDRHLRRPGQLRETRLDMAIRKYKPTTPGRRGASGSDFSEITRTEPEKSLVRPLHSHGRPERPRPHHHPAPGRRPQARLPADRLQADDKDGVPAKVAHIEYDPNRTARIALLHYADGEKRYILCPAGPAAGRPGGERAGRRHQAGQRAAAAQHPDRHRRSTPSSCARAAARRSRGPPAPGSSCWPRRAATRQLRMPSGEIRRVDVDLPGHGRRGRQRRAGQHQARQGRPQPVEGQRPIGPRRGHEPGRPPASAAARARAPAAAIRSARGASPRAVPARRTSRVTG